MFLIDSKGKRWKFGIIDPQAIEHYKPFPLDSLKNSFIRSGERIENKKILINVSDTIGFVLSANIKIGELEKGSYSAYLLYYCGKNIFNLFSEEKVRSDQQSNNAILFQGYIKSNIIKIIIK